jgi:DNA polymerase III subunit delta'
MLMQMASRSPAMARRKVFIIGDAERMAPQASSQEAANAFLKLLEEPLPDTTLILTSSEPGALLPTIRSRVVPCAWRRSRRRDASGSLPIDCSWRGAPQRAPAELLRLAAGAPGALIGAADRAAAIARARQFLAAADQGREQVLRAAFTAGIVQGPRRVLRRARRPHAARARSRARSRRRGDTAAAQRAARAVPAIEEAKRAPKGT